MPVKLWRKPLDIDKIKFPAGEVHIIEDRCKGCRFCIEYCPRDVLEESEEFNRRGAHLPKVKTNSSCIVCRFCEAVCPDFAIFCVEKNCEGDS